MTSQIGMAVTDSSQVGEVRRATVRLAESLGMSESRRSDAAIVATELSTNLARHAQGGRVWLQPLQWGGTTWLDLVAVDTGPGIGDLARCLQDGYSTRGTAGTGFGAIRRLSDEFDVYSSLPKGTAVLARLAGAPRPARPQVRFGAVAVPAPREEVCGDAWAAADDGGRVAVLVADGLGHGPLAADASDAAARVFSHDPRAEAKVFFSRAHEALKSGRGAAVARAMVDGSQVSFSGIGNVAAYLITDDGSKGLASQNGTVGMTVRGEVATYRYEWPQGGVLIMHSDGVARWSLDAYPGLLARHPALIAAVLARDFLRGRDDATVVAIGLDPQAAAS